MSGEKIEEVETPNLLARVMDTVFNDPSALRLQDNVYPWPADERLAQLPEKFRAEFNNGGKQFLLLRNGGQYFSFPTDLLTDYIEELSDINDLEQAGYPRIANRDLPNYGVTHINIEGVYSILADKR